MLRGWGIGRWLGQPAEELLALLRAYCGLHQLTGARNRPLNVQPAFKVRGGLQAIGRLGRVRPSKRHLSVLQNNLDTAVDSAITARPGGSAKRVV